MGESYAKAIESHHQKWQTQGIQLVGPLTGVGAMRGITLLNQDGTPGTEILATVLKMARERGLLLMPSGKNRNIIRLLAPLTIEPETLDKGLNILGECLLEIQNQSLS